MTSRAAIKILLGLVLGLPILQAVFLWVDGLLTAMGDNATSNVLNSINMGTRIVWLVCLVGLVITLSVQTLEEPRED